MKRNLGGMLAVLFLTLTLSFAQGSTGGSSDAGTARDNNQATNQPYGTGDNGRDRNWGWIGLFGLAGLAGLRRNNRNRQMNDGDRNVSDIRRAA